MSDETFPEPMVPQPAPHEVIHLDVAAIADTWAAYLDTFPAGSRVEKQDGFWHFYRGPGSTAHGAGKTLSRAIASVASSRRPNPETGLMEEIAEDGSVLAPE